LYKEKIEKDQHGVVGLDIRLGLVKAENRGMAVNTSSLGRSSRKGREESLARVMSTQLCMLNAAKVNKK
jgi:hypothetical protein